MLFTKFSLVKKFDSHFLQLNSDYSLRLRINNAIIMSKFEAFYSRTIFKRMNFVLKISVESNYVDYNINIDSMTIEALNH